MAVMLNAAARRREGRRAGRRLNNIAQSWPAEPAAISKGVVMVSRANHRREPRGIVNVSRMIVIVAQSASVWGLSSNHAVACLTFMKSSSKK